MTYFQILYFVSMNCHVFNSRGVMIKVSSVSDDAYNFYNNLHV